MQVVEFAPRVRPAGSFVDRPVLVKRIEACVSIGLQHTLEVSEMGLRMDAFAIRCIGKPHGRWRSVATWPVIAHVGPQACRFCLPISRCQHRDRGVVGVQLGAG